MKETIIVIDFETTGLSPARGAKATEVAAVRLVDDEIVDSFHSLMQPGAFIPVEIVKLTGITNEMVRVAPSAVSVMRQLAAFIVDAPLVAHNARFDQAFFKAEFAHANLLGHHSFACTMKLARRIYPRAPNFKLQTILQYADIPHGEQFHRALSDAMATARLWLQMKRDLCARHRLQRLSHAQLTHLGNLPPSDITRQIETWR